MKVPPPDDCLDMRGGGGGDEVGDSSASVAFSLVSEG